jgi:CRISPR-associated RAMP protein (TIGR02581 family)
MHKTKYNSLYLELSILPKSPLLVKAGGISANPSLPDMQFVRTFTEKGETIFIPGASLKGVVRSYVEKVLRTKSKKLACDIVDKDKSCTKRIEGIEKKEDRNLLSHEIYYESCKACRLFGNGKLKSRASFLDAYPEGEVKTETRYGVAISRLTHAVATGPFEMEVLVKGNFKTKLHLENFECGQIGLISPALQGLNSGLIRIGFGKNRGFGEVEVKVNKIEFSFCKDDIPKNEIWGIGKFAGEERKNYGFEENDVIKIKPEPSKEYEETLYTKREYQARDWDEISSSAISALKEVLK